MKSDKDNLQQAINSLAIHDVYLRDSKVSLVENFDAKTNQSDLSIYFRVTTHGHTLLALAEKPHLVRYLVNTGLRLTEGDNAKVCAEIEADFYAEYLVTREVDEDALQTFGEKNAVFHVWPYWREYLQSTCARCRLPPIVMPMHQIYKSAKQVAAEPPE